MKNILREIFFKRVIIVLLLLVIVLSSLNTYLILESSRTSSSNLSRNYDFVLSQIDDFYVLTSILTGVVEKLTSASTAINFALTEGNSLYIEQGRYFLTDDIYIKNKVNFRLISDGSTIIGNGNKIIVYGDDYATSMNGLISGLSIINSTIRVENSFGTTISGVVFQNTSTGVEFANTKTWSEYNKIENCQFINATEGIAFRTPVGNATGSYSSSKIVRCSFKLIDFSIGIKVEELAEFSDSQIQNVRFWMGENGRANQTGILVDGSMYQTLLISTVFESFTYEPVYIFGIDIGVNCDPAPILDSGVSFLGNWTTKVHNPFGVWLSAVGSVFEKENINVSVGLDGKYDSTVSIQVYPLKIFGFKPKIEVTGSFDSNETVIVRIRLEMIDNVISKSIVRAFSSNESVWLTDDEMMVLFPSQSVIWAILVDAKTSSGSTDAVVEFSCYGTAG